MSEPHDKLFTILVPQAGRYGWGDATLDGKINVDDLVTSTFADFDVEGWTDFGDLVALAQNYGEMKVPACVRAEFQADWALAQASFPSRPH